MTCRNPNCLHERSLHREWWDATDEGGGSGLGCVACDCDDFYNEHSSFIPQERTDCGGNACAGWDRPCDACDEAPEVEA